MESPLWVCLMRGGSFLGKGGSFWGKGGSLWGWVARFRGGWLILGKGRSLWGWVCWFWGRVARYGRVTCFGEDIKRKGMNETECLNARAVLGAFRLRSSEIQDW